MANQKIHTVLPDQPQIIRRLLKMVAGCAVAICAISCASFESSEWHSGHVNSVIRADEAIPDADNRCNDTTTKRTEGAIALVRIRVHRAPYDVAVPFDPQMALVNGERVYVQLASCQLRRTMP